MVRLKEEYKNNYNDLNNYEINDLDKDFNYMDIISVIARDFYKERCRLKMNQKEFSKKLGISQAMLSKIEVGKINPSIKFLNDLTWKVSNNSDFLIKNINDILIVLNNSKYKANETYICNESYDFNDKLVNKTKYTNNKKIIEYSSELNVDYNLKQDIGGKIYA